MSFILRMAQREMRASWRRLVLFFLCIALGVASMVSVRSLTDLLAASVTDQARVLLSADVRIETNRPPHQELRTLIAQVTATSLITTRTDIIDASTMARAANRRESRPVMVEVRGVQGTFPLRGNVRLRGAEPYSHRMLADRGALVSPNLLARLNLQIGDAIVIGESTFTIRGVAERIPGNGLNFGPMPRVVVDYPELERAGLLGVGSRARYAWLFTTLPMRETEVAQAIADDFRPRSLNVGVFSFHTLERWLNASIDNNEGFANLVGIAILVLGGIGIASVTRFFVQQKLKTIAILKCVGAGTRRIIATYLVQTIALSIVGSVLGLAVAYALSVAATPYLARLIPLDIHAGLSWSASLEGVVVGMLVTLLFSLPPLLEIRRVKPLLLLRQQTASRTFDWAQVAARVVLGLILIALAAWRAGTYPRARIFIAAVVVTAFILNVSGAALIAGVRRVCGLTRSRSNRTNRAFALRYGIDSLSRPGNQTKAVLFAVGIGALFLVSVRQFQLDAQAAYGLDVSTLSGDMFVVDVQNDQRAGVEAAFSRQGATNIQMMPIVRARMVGLTSAREEQDPKVAAQLRGRAGGEHRLSYRAALNDRETIVAGAFWDPSVAGEPEISVDERFARAWRLEVGDRLTFDVLGARIEAPVTSIRRVAVEMRTLASLVRTDLLFRPGVLDAVPHTFVGVVKAPAGAADRAALQNALVEQFPNLTIVDALDEIAELRERLNQASLAMSILGGLVLGCGCLILTGSIAMTRLQRVYETAILKTLGATRGMLVKIAVAEYGALGALAGVVGSVAAVVVTWSLITYGQMPIPWHARPVTNVLGILATVFLVAFVGVLASWHVLVKKPIDTLREQ